MADFKALANKLITSTFGDYQKALTICTINGTTEEGTAIDITNNFIVDGKPSEDFDYVLATNVDQWNKLFDQGNADLIFQGNSLKILKVEKDPADAAYFITAKTYDRKTVVIQSVTETPDGQGGFTSVWTTFATVQAEIEYMDGSEAMSSGRLGISQMIKMIFRYQAGITEKMRVVYNSDNMPIRSAINVNAADEWTNLIVERDVAS
jgi:SPP1 family predicted phage head-tail adaptor